MSSTSFEHALNIKSINDLSLNTFQTRHEYEANKNLIETRSITQKPYKKIKDIKTVWDIEPIDFSVKLYHPKPHKRNSRESIKPWSYDKFLKKENESDLLTDKNISSNKKSVEQVVLNNILNNQRRENESTDSKNFQTWFRVLTPNGARNEVSKNMSFREGLNQFNNPKPYDFRGLKSLYGAPEFYTRFEKDPLKIKFLSSTLSQINGLPYGINLREEDDGLQIGALVKKSEPHYDPSLILPRLSFPNKYNTYTRFRRRDRSIQSAFWDRVIPKLENKLKNDSFISKKRVDSDLNLSDEHN